MTMKKSEVSIGGTYKARVSGQEVEVKIVTADTLGGWLADNLETGRRIRIKTAARLRPLSAQPAPCKPKAIATFTMPLPRGWAKLLTDKPTE